MRTKTKQARENAKLDLESLRKLYFLRKNLLERYVKEQCRYEITLKKSFAESKTGRTIFIARAENFFLVGNF